MGKLSFGGLVFSLMLFSSVGVTQGLDIPKNHFLKLRSYYNRYGALLPTINIRNPKRCMWYLSRRWDLNGDNKQDCAELFPYIMFDKKGIPLMASNFPTHFWVDRNRDNSMHENEIFEIKSFSYFPSKKKFFQKI